MKYNKNTRGALLAALAAVLAGCGAVGGSQALPDPRIQAAWVELGEAGVPLARVITTAADCPTLDVDHVARPMTVRAAAGTVPLRPTASAPADSKPSAFLVTTCEASLPTGVRSARAGGHPLPLPLPQAEPKRIVILGDTGCRLKKSDNAWQACNDGNAWPLARIAATAAAMRPDLVIHVGDYHYRETACPDGNAGCAGSPWGYGWDTWQADLFAPARPLLAAAPWVMVRGNHEECGRAGQGWFRFLDPRPFRPESSCDDSANDAIGNFTEPYAVPLGADAQLIVFDSAKSPRKALQPGDAAYPIYQRQLEAAARLAAKPGVRSLWASHHPVLALVPLENRHPVSSGAGLQPVMNAVTPGRYFPPGVELAMHGHVHNFQAISFKTDHPATLVIGNGGDNVDVDLPDPLPAGVAVAPNAVIDQIAHSNRFGFTLLERDGPRWRYQSYTRDGKLLTSCEQHGSKLQCSPLGLLKE